jgi:signal transduction histidine kinase
MITLRDISDFLELQKQRNLSKLKTIVFAQAAHEFRNPLNGIVTSIDMLNNYINHEAGGTYYKVAKNCSNLMLFLVNDILDFA